MKLLLWKLGLLKEDICPIDNSNLTPHGFVGSNRRYTCDNIECKFNR